ncbi:MAG: sugar phosphate isomerase/epimerase [Nitrospirae bacterium]|nr:sugar phosphate isomerase/epimerase [Nitrospirota bacterium]
MVAAGAGPHVHIPCDKISEHAQLLNQHKLNLEIYFNSSFLDAVDAASYESLLNNLTYIPSLSFHAPFMDLSPGAIDAKVREATVMRFNQMLDIAEVLKPLCIVFHSGYEKWKYGLSIDLWLQKSIETWGPLNERAKRSGVKIAIENIFEDNPANLALLMKEMGSGNFGICFDSGHCNLFSKVPLSEWLDDLAPHITELHLHDNDRSADQHLPIGDGTFDFSALLSSLKDAPVIHTIEAHSPERVLTSISRLEALMSSIVRH